MGLFHMHYDCHPGALIMRKEDGAVFRVVGNVSLWDMRAVIVQHEDDAVTNDNARVVDSKDFKAKYLILDAGVDELAGILDGLRQLPK